MYSQIHPFCVYACLCVYIVSMNENYFECECGSKCECEWEWEWYECVFACACSCVWVKASVHESVSQSVCDSQSGSKKLRVCTYMWLCIYTHKCWLS